MGVKSLNIEFESEEEIKDREKKSAKNEGSSDKTAPDLEFTAVGVKMPSSSEIENANVSNDAEAVVSPDSKVEEPEPQKVVPISSAPAPTPAPAPAPTKVETDPIVQEVATQNKASLGQADLFHSSAELKEALMKVAVAEEKIEWVARYTAEMKELELESIRIINKIYAKNPALKKELLTLKKIIESKTNIDNLLKKELPKKEKKKAS